MKNFLYSFLLLAFAGLFQNVRSTGCKSSITGKEFFFGVLRLLDSCCDASNHIRALDITNVSPNDARIRLQIPYLKIDTYYDIPYGESKNITISQSIERDGTFIDSRGIKLSSSNDVSVLVSGIFNSPYSIDSYNVLPVTAAGKKYMISSYGSLRRGGVVLVAGVSDNTLVTIVNGTNILQSAIISKFDVFQYFCAQCDLTGVKIISDKNVFVVSGSTFTGIPLRFGGSEYIASEMIPESSLSLNYIVAPVLPKTAFMLRIMSEMPLSVKVSNFTRSFTVNTSPNDLYFGTDAVVVTAKDPFSVTQYGVSYGYDNVNSDPFMTVIPGIDQYINQYKFTVPHGHFVKIIHYIAIIIPEIHIHGLVLDGVPLNHTTKSMSSRKVPAPFDTYTILTLPVNEGFHHILHSDQSVTFGVFLYGHGGDGARLSYAFYAGYDLDGHCTSTGKTTSQSTTTLAPTTYPTGSLNETGQMCYSCEDPSHVDLCDTVKQCGKQEVCFVERFTDSGQIKYKTGCLQNSVCEMKRNESLYSDALCFECCDGDYCNNKGCGENGIPDRDRRGPICFDCQHVSSPSECMTIAPCESYQVCQIEEYKWFDHSHFKLGCGHVLCDPANKIASHVFKRATPVCHSCCSDDYCNRNCTTDSQGQSGSIIVG